MEPLPTIYNGKKYRSSTEARWHAYFDLIGFDVMHELDGYNINGRNYLPDFTATNGSGHNYYDGHPDKNMPWFVEVKGCKEKALEEWSFMQEFSEATQSLVSIVWGQPSLKPFDTFIRGEQVCPSVYCHYGFTEKGWSEPYYVEHEPTFMCKNDPNLVCVEKIRSAHRTRSGELII